MGAVEPMKHIEIPALDPEQRAALENLYRATHKARLRTRAQNANLTEIT